MGCLCMTNNNLVIKSKDIILNDEIKKDNHNEDINNDINILITKNSENMPKVENKSLEKPTKINKEKIKKERSINSQSNIFNSKLKNKFNKDSQRPSKKFCSGPIISLLESRFERIHKNKLNNNNE